MPFNFGLMDTNIIGKKVKEHVLGVEKFTKNKGWPNYVLANHDRPRIASRFGTEKTRISGLLLLTLRGTPTLYYG